MNKQKPIFSHLYNPSTLLDNYKAHSDPIYYIQQVCTTQRIILLQSLRMIIGFQGQIFKYNNIEGFHLTYIPQLKHLTPQALANIISLFTNFSNQIKYVNNKIIQFRKEQNVILHELLNAVQQYLKQNVQFFTQLTVLVEFQAGKINRKHAVNTQLGHESQNPMTLIKLNAIVAIRFQTTKIISDIFQKILPALSSPLNLSIVVLNSIWQLLDKFEHQPLTSSSSQLLLKLINQPLKKYLQLVCSWFGQKMSNTDSTYKQFFIKRDEDDYKIVDTLIPVFLKNTSKQVFDCGNFIKIIYCFANQQDKMNINQFMNTNEQFQKLFKLIDKFIINKKRVIPLKQKNKVKPFQTISSMMKKQKTNILKIEAEQQVMPYDLHISAKGIFQLAFIPSPIRRPVPLEEQFEQLGNAHSLFLSEFKLRFEIGWNYLLETIKSKCSEYFSFKQPIPPFDVLPEYVINHLFFISNFILFEKGDFIQELIDTIGEELDRPVSVIQQNLLSDLIKTSIQNSNARFVQQDYIKNLHFKFLSKDSSYSGWDMFYLQYRLSPPFHHLFPQDTMQKYNIIFNFVWRLKHLQYLLRNISTNDKGKRNTKYYFIFRTALNQFSSSVISEILLKIKQSWNSFIQSLNKVQTLNQFLNLHNQVISNLQKITFISSKDKDRQTHLRLQNITNIVLKVRDLQNDDIQMDDRDKQRQIVKLSQEFKMRIRDLVHVNKSFTEEMIDFTGFYE